VQPTEEDNPFADPTAGATAGQMATGGSASNCYVESRDGNSYPDTNVTGNTLDSTFTDLYRVRLLNNYSSVQLKRLAPATPSIPHSIDVTGNLGYSGVLNLVGSFSYDNNSVNNTSENLSQRVAVVRITQSPNIGSTYSMIIGNSGGGVGAATSIFDPDNGTFTYGTSDPSISFTVRGTGGNSYTMAVTSSNGHLTIQRTAGSAPYTVDIYRLY
jgi:hypothetical protein